MSITDDEVRRRLWDIRLEAERRFSKDDVKSIDRKHLERAYIRMFEVIAEITDTF